MPSLTRGLALIVVGFVDGRLAQEDVVKARRPEFAVRYGYHQRARARLKPAAFTIAVRDILHRASFVAGSALRYMMPPGIQASLICCDDCASIGSRSCWFSPGLEHSGLSTWIARSRTQSAAKPKSGK